MLATMLHSRSSTNKRIRKEQYLRDMLKVGQGLEVAEEMEMSRKEADAPRPYHNAYACAARYVLSYCCPYLVSSSKHMPQ